MRIIFYLGHSERPLSIRIIAGLLGFLTFTQALPRQGPERFSNRHTPLPAALPLFARCWDWPDGLDGGEEAGANLDGEFASTSIDLSDFFRSPYRRGRQERIALRRLRRWAPGT